MKLKQIRKSIFEAGVGEPTAGQEGFDQNFWGNAGAGALFLAADTGRILFSHRSEDVFEPGTWGTFGGAMEEGESPSQAAQREAQEEGADVDTNHIIPLYVFKHPSGFQYFNFLVIVPSEFGPRPTWETQGYEWVDYGNWPSPLHPGAKLLLSDDRSLRMIRRYSKEATGGEERLDADIGDYKTIGNWDKATQGYKKAVDRRMITNPVVQARARDKFARTDHPFNFYFVNLPGLGQHRETGAVDRAWVEKNLPKAAAEIPDDPEHINVIFVGNQAGEWRPMTPWIMAHRIGHAFMPGYSPRGNSMWGMKEAHDSLVRYTSYILESVYNRSDRPTDASKLRALGYSYPVSGTSRELQREFITFWEHVGNFKSARDGNIRDWFEVINELLAQYLTTGDITFRPLPQNISKRQAFKNPGIYMGAKDADLEWGNSSMEDLAQELKDYFDNALSEAIGKYFVM